MSGTPNSIAICGDIRQGIQLDINMEAYARFKVFVIYSVSEKT